MSFVTDSSSKLVITSPTLRFAATLDSAAILAVTVGLSSTNRTVIGRLHLPVGGRTSREPQRLACSSFTVAISANSSRLEESELWSVATRGRNSARTEVQSRPMMSRYGDHYSKIFQ